MKTNVIIEKKHILWMILTRLVILTLLLILSLIISSTVSFLFPFVPFIYVIGCGYILSAVFLWLWHLGKKLLLQAYFQVLVDLALVTALVYASGGVSSSAYILYLLPIIGAGLVISGRAAYLMAALSAIFFGVLADLMYFGLVKTPEVVAGPALTLGYVIYEIAVAWSAFFIIAFLTSSLRARLVKANRALQVAQKELSIKERLSEAGRVSAALAHEIRNPLAAISGAVQVISKEIRLTPDQQALMDIVLRESNRVSRTLDQFLDYAVPVKEVFVQVNLRSLVEETLKMLEVSGELNGLVEVGGNFRRSGLTYFASASQLRQVCLNIIKNSLRAMPQGGKLDIDLNRSRGSIELRFADTGCGMTEDELNHLFDPFYSRFEGGRGLGLSIVRRVIEDYDGRIKVSSEPDRGTEVLITLPARPEA